MQYRRLAMYPKQALIDAPTRYVIIEGSTKSGKTVSGMDWIARQAMLAPKPGRNFWWMAPIFGQAADVYRRFQESARQQAIPQAAMMFHEGRMSILLGNGSTISFKSADNPDSLYGADVWGVVIDEASRCKEESWHAIRSTVGATGGQIRLIGNVKGRKNWAYRLARQAEAGHPDMTYGKITALDAVAAGVLPMSEVEDARRIYPERVFRELWLAEPSDDEGNPFDARAIRACIGPLSPERIAVWGIDLGKHVDWTVLVGLDVAGTVAAWDRFQKPWPETISTISRIVKGTPTLVDSTGLGDPIVDQLQREAGSLVEGFRFTAGSKQQIMEGLAVAIQEHQVRFPDGPIVRELESFEYVAHRTGVTYSAPEGLHDDCVCALALAVYHLRSGHVRSDATLWGGGL